MATKKQASKINAQPRKGKGPSDSTRSVTLIKVSGCYMFTDIPQVKIIRLLCESCMLPHCPLERK